MVDLSFDSNKHDQTRQDASSGADSLHTVAQAAEAFANAQVADMWGSEEGVEAARQALQSAYDAVGRGFASEGDQFRDFGKMVDEAEEAFMRAEEELVRLLAGTESDLSSISFIQKLAVGSVGAQALKASGTLPHAAAAPVGATAASMQDDSRPSAVGAQTGM